MFVCDLKPGFAKAVIRVWVVISATNLTFFTTAFGTVTVVVGPVMRAHLRLMLTLMWTVVRWQEGTLDIVTGNSLDILLESLEENFTWTLYCTMWIRWISRSLSLSRYTALFLFSLPLSSLIRFLFLSLSFNHFKSLSNSSRSYSNSLHFEQGRFLCVILSQDLPKQCLRDAL